VAQFVANYSSTGAASTTTTWQRVLESLTLALSVRKHDMISKGIGPIRWVQANVPDELLDEGIIHKVAYVDDEEPSVNYYGASASIDSFPVVEIATTSRDDMRCAHCWCKFD
jgi:hypothetical protein